MNIVIDGRYINDHFPGIGRYLFNLVAALAELDSAHHFVVVHNPAVISTRHDLASLKRLPMIELVATAARPFSLGEQRAIPALLRHIQADLFHAPYYVRPYLGLACPVVTTLYDAIPRLFPHEVSLRARLLYDLLTRLSIRSSQRLITISQSARRDLITAFGIAPHTLAVTPLAAESRFQPQTPEVIAAVRQRYDLPENYVLCVSSNKPHKNLARLVEAWANVETNWPLILAGHWDDRYAEAKVLGSTLALGDRLRFLPNVRDQDLPALYTGCAVFVFPSCYEGFGLPPLEALACGAAVLCGSTSSLPEVVGDAALHVDVANTAALTAGITRLLNDTVLHAQLRTNALHQAARFSWHNTAVQTLAVYKELGAGS